MRKGTLFTIIRDDNKQFESVHREEMESNTMLKSLLKLEDYVYDHPNQLYFEWEK